MTTRARTGRLAGTTALVTGASQGLGRAVALAYAREGADLLLVARRSEPLERVRAEAEGLGARAVAASADVGDPAAVERVAAAALTAFDRIDVLVNNASELGPTPMPYLLDTDPEALRRVLEVNLLGPFLLTKALLGPMLAAGRGSVINVSSDAGVVGYPGWGAYGVSKAAVDQMTRIWASELEGSGVRVNSVDPGDMATAMHATALPDDDPATLARPEDRTEVFVHLAEGDGAAVHGQRLEAAAFPTDRETPRRDAEPAGSTGR
jgi:NAD(P)-dependent dehydrogenase (short-subunit alcohol dehydrogenase family)